jgi:F-type H+-transporting ATPase subunit b
MRFDMKAAAFRATAGALATGLVLLGPVAAWAQEGAEGGAEDSAGGGLFAVDPGLWLWTIIVFVIVLTVLAKFAWGPILKGLESREAGIRGAIDEAAKQRSEAAGLLEEHKRQLADARRQAQELVQEGREAGQRLRAEIETKAREEGDRLLERARNEINREREQAVEALRRESVDLALAAASMVLGKKLDAAADRQLVEDYLKGLDRPAADA